MADDQKPLSTSYARMLERGQIRDPIRNIIAAGKSTAIFDDSAEKDVQSEIYFPLPPTPRTLQRFRRNYNPGEINRHYGSSHGLHSEVNSLPTLSVDRPKKG